MRTRALPTAVIVSAVVHGAIAARIAWAPGDDEVVGLVTPPQPPIAIEPVEFALLDPPAVAAAIRSQNGEALARAATRASASSTSPRRGELPPHPDAKLPAGPAQPNPLAMRKPELAGLSPAHLADFLARTRPLPEAPDLPGARIEAGIADLRAKLKDPRVVANTSPDELAAMRARLAGLARSRDQVELKANQDGTYTTEKETFVARVGKDGRVKLSDKPNLRREGLGLKFDLTDAAMRAAGIDPYAAAKLHYLDRTRAQRVEIGKQYTREQLAQSADYARQNVDRLWRQSSDLAARKQGLFELWDECEESGDAARVAGGQAARAYIIRFIQLKLVGPDAYTVDELARLNKGRRSRTRFVPY